MSKTGRAAMSIASSDSFMDLVLSIRCPEHDASGGEPCWNDPRGVCGVEDRLCRQAESQESAVRNIHASHRDVELDAELRQSEADRLDAIEHARDAAHQPQDITRLVPIS
jgi:hypothetical protein